MHCFDCFCTSKSSRTLIGSSVNKVSCYCSGRCGRRIPYIFAYTYWNILVYGCLSSSATHITEDARPKIVVFYFQNWVGNILLSLLPIKVANSSFVTVWNLSPHRLPKIHDQQWLMLVDHHFEDVVGCMSLFVLIIKDANTSKPNTDVAMEIFSD